MTIEPADRNASHYVSVAPGHKNVIEVFPSQAVVTAKLSTPDVCKLYGHIVLVLRS